MSDPAAPVELLADVRPDARETSELGRYLRWLETHRGLAFDGYVDLHRWSVEDLEGFWSSVWDFNDAVSRAPYERVLGSAAMPGARWFPGARLNYAEHCLRAADDPDAVAVFGFSQTRGPVELTFRELGDRVARARAGLVRLGVGSGDRVVAYLPNLPETVVAYLATASIGAVWASCAPEFGAPGVIDRFAQVTPTVLLAVSGYVYGDTLIDRRGEVATLRAGLRTVRARRARPVRRRRAARLSQLAGAAG